MKKQPTSGARPELSASRKAYEPPRLERLGSLRELTKAFIGTTADGFASMSKN